MAVRWIDDHCHLDRDPTVAAEQVHAAAHTMAPIELSAEDKIAKSVGAGAVVLITGANRGLGFEFAKQYAERGCKIIATARNPADSAELNKLAASHKDFKIEALDVTDRPAIEALALKYADQPIDLSSKLITIHYSI